MQRLKVAVLGAGGLVAQRLQQRLSNHPWFTLAGVAGSPRYHGQNLHEVPWILDEDRPELPDLTVGDVASEEDVHQLASEGVAVAFSSLPRDQALLVEPLWVKAGITVFSNASAFRGHEGVPLVIPEVNGHDLRTPSGGDLGHACATNCTLLPLIFPLAALHQSHGLRAYSMRSEQGLSGGGHAYMSAALGQGSVDAAIPGEAEKTEAEFAHVLGWQGEAELRCERVMRADGHHVFVEATFHAAVNEDEVRTSFERWSNENAASHLPSAPRRPLVVVDRIDPTLHLFADGEAFPVAPNPATELAAGMAVVVGEIECPTANTVRFEAYSHNTIRGAAGGVIFLAELAHSMELLSSKTVHP